jgi:hypothetical protein
MHAAAGSEHVFPPVGWHCTCEQAALHQCLTSRQWNQHTAAASHTVAHLHLCCASRGQRRARHGGGGL